jgi:hypothetical protein
LSRLFFYDFFGDDALRCLKFQTMSYCFFHRFTSSCSVYENVMETIAPETILSKIL